MALFLYDHASYQARKINKQTCDICFERKKSFVKCDICTNIVCVDCAKTYYVQLKNPNRCMVCANRMNIDKILPWCKWCKKWSKKFLFLDEKK